MATNPARPFAMVSMCFVMIRYGRRYPGVVVDDAETYEEGSGRDAESDSQCADHYEKRSIAVVLTGGSCKCGCVGGSEDLVMRAREESFAISCEVNAAGDNKPLCRISFHTTAFS
jgi:hypothetical protein